MATTWTNLTFHKIPSKCLVKNINICELWVNQKQKVSQWLQKKIIEFSTDGEKKNEIIKDYMKEKQKEHFL